MWQLHLIHLNLADEPAAMAAVDGRTASGVLVLLGAITCAALVSSAARLLQQMFDMLRDLLRVLLLTVVAALIVLALVVLAFVDLIHG